MPRILISLGLMGRRHKVRAASRLKHLLVMGIGG